MKIQSSVINMESKSTFYAHHSKNESLKTWVGNNRQGFSGNNGSQPSMLQLRLDILDLSEKGKAMQSAEASNITVDEENDIISLGLSDTDRLKIDALEKMIEALTGKKFKFHIIDKIKLDKNNKNLNRTDLLSNTEISQPQSQQRQGWGLEYEYHELNIEQQKMSFSASGIVKTEDGREINFSTHLSMSREFISRTDISIRAGDAVMKDPLVINFTGSAPALTDRKYCFDLDADGTEDQISFVNPGSGFLALDLNSDGIINNGLELFGPQSGNGFAELSKYDDDSNGWIDENDAIYEKLRIWSKDENGNDQLIALGQKGVGAIYLGNISTGFEIKNIRNEIQGAVRNTGIFLRENGTSGTIQHIDLAL